MKVKRLFLLTGLLVLSMLFLSCRAATPAAAPSPEPTRPAPTLLPQATATSTIPRATDTPRPNTSTATATATQTLTPPPDTLTPTPQPTATPQPAATATVAPTLPGLPVLSDATGFREWSKFNRQPVAGRTHGLTNIYINQPCEKIAPGGTLVFPFPEGSLIVKETLSSGDIALMRKVSGYDPTHNDWQFAEYRADGTLLARNQVCWDCHIGVQRTDYVFTVLENP